MDYGALLYKAQENNRNASNKEVRCYKTSFAPPKKIERSKVSSDNIKKFLARKEEEEKRRREEAQRKKEELLALRSQDKKAQRRVQVMLKSTKSANKSVMEDAIDNVNTADTLNGFKQCDEDDYGYVSQEASAFYTKLLNKYENMPPEAPKFQPSKKEVKDLNAAKDRVRAALQKEAEEELLPHKRKRKKHDEDNEEPDDKKDSGHANSDSEKHSECQSGSKKEKETNSANKKRKNLAPPPLNFDQLLQIAQKKQFEPIMVDESLLKKEPERLMTKKQKLEFEREQEIRLNKNKRVLNKPNSVESQPKEEPTKKSSKETNITVQSEKKKRNDLGKSEKSSDHITNKTDKSDHSAKVDKKVNNTPAVNGPSKPLENKILMDRLKKDSNVWSKSSNNSHSESDSKASKNINLPSSKQSNVPAKNAAKIEKKPHPEVKSNKTEAPTADKGKKMSELELQIQKMQEEHKLLMKKLKMQEIQMKKINTKEKEIQNKKIVKKVIPEKRKPPPVSKRRIDSESEEYDSELDDFIDDGPEDGSADYSKYISEIFGYDKSKYARVEDDDEDECMESNFAQISKEEFVSAKIGLLEDLEDIRKEQEEKKRQKAKKMKQLIEARKKKK